MMMKYPFCLIAVALSLAACAAENPAAWLQREIDAVAAKGGGRVTVSAGVHPCGTLHLRSGIELHLEKDAVLKGPADWRAYDDVDDACIGKRPEGSSKVLIAAYGVTNVAITGEGVIDAQGPLFYNTNVPPGAHFEKPDHPRPRMLQFFRCRGVRFEDVTFKDSPGWTCWLRECEDIEVTRLHILADQRMINNDGLHVDGCRHVRIGESEFRTGDDCVVMRANRAEGTRLVCEDMVVSNCTMDSTCQAIRLSCPSDDTIRHARFFNLKMSGNNGVTCGLPDAYVAPWDEGCATMEDITVEDCTIDAKWHAICFYADPGVKARAFGNVTFRNITLTSAFPIMLKGTADAPLVNLRFENVKGTVAAKSPFIMEGVEGISFEKVEISSGKGEHVPFARPPAKSWEARRWPFRPAATHDRGGVSYDLQKMSDARYAGLFAVSNNILAKPWCGTYTNDQGSCVIALPHDRGGLFRVSCRTKLTRLKKDGNRAIMMRIGSGEGSAWKQTQGRVNYAWCGFVDRNDRWYPATATVAVNPGETHAWLRFHNQNSITEIKDLVVHEEVPKPSDALRIETAQITARGGEYELSEGQVGSIGYNFVQSGRYDYDLTKMKLRFVLPPGVGFVDSTGIEKGSVSLATRPDGRTVAAVRLPAGDVPESNAWWAERMALLEATRGVGDCGEGWLEADYDDGIRKISARSKPIRFRIGPTIRVTAPKRYANGIMTMLGGEFAERASMDRYAKFAADAGCRWVLPSPNPRTGLSADLVDAWRQAGMTKVIAYANPGCRNAIEIGPGGTPPEDQFVRDAGPRLRMPIPERTMCPLAVAARTAFYREKVLPWMRQQFRGADGAWANWEPWIYAGRGCCCLRCRAAFAKYLGRDESEIAAGWPTNALPNGALYAKAKDFRSLCHANVVKTLDADIKEMTGGASSIGLMPAMCWVQLTRKGVEQGGCEEFKPADYACALQWVEPWGPYTPNWTVAKPYLRSRSASLFHFVAAREMRRHVDEAYPADARPKMLAAPQGTTGEWVTHPEVFEMSFDAFFFNRHEATAPWVFPSSTDAVYWRAFANATARAAKYEAFVWDGKSADERVGAETVPEYAPTMPQVGQLDYIRDVSFLQTNAYDLDGARIVAAFSTWECGEAFFTLKNAGLQGNFTVVSDDGTHWAKTTGDTVWTGAELEEGIFVSVGAARTRVFEIVPEGKAGPTVPRAVMTATAVRAAYAGRKADLAEKAAADRRLAEIEGVYSDQR